ncbi:N-formylglutamate deformylase [Alsobacter metallidurans]|uniref:N-formylglutamate deformylase n=1 Tax=Alsobacter metallidurans TaxID=340221 RepID=A0A917MFY1_9HYPH|nr:N-formylglutamate deformylase [Alsobacter metallidurans]GGH06898.1 N-formylglutamate deformylase [Alsobacter metallidurans]
MSDWLTVERRDAPLLLSIPHTGTEIPAPFDRGLASPWLARKDADWHIETLYGFARELGATIVHTAVSRTVIDVNRDPSGASLYPGQATTELCPSTSFDGEALYEPGHAPDAASVAERRRLYFEPYHAALGAELQRLRTIHPKVVLYDCHSIRSAIPRLFEGELPNFNIGTNAGASCDPSLTAAVEAACDGAPFTRVTNGRFKGGWITRFFGAPEQGVHAIQMELACRGYMRETPGPVREGGWPTAFDPAYAAPITARLRAALEACLHFAAAR